MSTCMSSDAGLLGVSITHPSILKSAVVLAQQCCEVTYSDHFQSDLASCNTASSSPKPQLILKTVVLDFSLAVLQGLPACQ